LNDTNEIKIGDLGEAKHVEASFLSTISGTPAYMSPEMHEKYMRKVMQRINNSNQTDSNEITPQTDIWFESIKLLNKS
jgi:serine/threonine protein kinase